jgi:hypothetical protein
VTLIEPLKYLEAISVIKEVPTEGHSPLIVIADDYCQYYIKNTRNKKPDYNILNEFLCHYLLRLWQIPTPDIAAIRLVPERLPNNLSHWHKKHFYDTITFGSKRVANSFELNMFVETQGKIELRKIANPEILVKLGLFDIWVENTDRKPTNSNILLVSDTKLFEIMAIDNAFTFDSQSYRNLYMGITNTYDQNILNTDLAKSIIDIYYKKQDWSWTDSLKEYFYICIGSCQQFFNEIVNNVPQELGFTADLHEALKNFLFNEERNKQVFDEFLTRL